MSTAAALEPLIDHPPQPHGDETLYEIIDGQKVELPPLGWHAGFIASFLQGKLCEFAYARRLGYPVVEVLFHLSLPVDRNRRPDVAFVSTQRCPRGRPVFNDANAWDVVPNLAVEVISPTDLVDELLERLEEYFRAGVQLVWVIFPRRRVVQVYQSLTRLHGLTAAEVLDGGDVLPGFRLPLAELFFEDPGA